VDETNTDTSDEAISLALELVKVSARSVRDRERDLKEARERLEELIVHARQCGATTVAITAAAQVSRTTVHKALTRP